MQLGRWHAEASSLGSGAAALCVSPRPQVTAVSSWSHRDTKSILEAPPRAWLSCRPPTGPASKCHPLGGRDFHEDFGVDTDMQFLAVLFPNHGIALRAQQELPVEQVPREVMGPCFREAVGERGAGVRGRSGLGGPRGH